jgi:hypothetical protein
MRFTLSALFVSVFFFFVQFNLSTLSASELTDDAVVLSEKQLFDLKVNELYEQCGLASIVDPEAFRNAMVGYINLSQEKPFANRSVITIVDFNKPSTEKRLYVIDLASKKLLFHTYAAHGKNTGDNMAEKFSNTMNSNQSSLGFYETAETYTGKQGFSLRLNGRESGINNNALNRGIVVHGANYVSESFIKANGRLGRSQGCPALPVELNEKVIDAIKGGSCLYINKKDSNYMLGSSYLDDAAAVTYWPLLAAI